ncbi:DNA repair protein RecO [Roseibacillus ishigakijimensis]|uniref:DNA repair protein RecO n=1 Tax=Roseibacillus ishigakijimensis TaxID=454146 RepID=A0A934RML2_9BACT|nr:DNA repair protein RecO [Roseibacillus ishigakijimensis]MBK1834577.1 DNA repair protein RecO [Roseibacillus ishigakijimensis]
METAQGIIIRTRKLTETSLIVSWCTVEWGLLKTVAKGARGRRSAFAGQLDLFVEAEFAWVRSRASELHALRELRVVDLRASLRREYARTVVAAYLGELVERAVEGEAAVPEIHDLLRRALDFLAGGGELARALPFFEKELAERLGVGRGAGYVARLEEVLAGGFPRSRREAMRLLER